MPTLSLEDAPHQCPRCAQLARDLVAAQSARALTTDDITSLVGAVGEVFRTFGGGAPADASNPLTHWMQGEPLKFALGVDVRAVVEFVLSSADVLRRERVA